MNLFHVIANRTSPKEGPLEPLSTGLISARAESSAPARQDFSKLLSQSMKLRHPVRQAEPQRQDLADQETRPRNDSKSEAPESDSRPLSMTRDARFVPGGRAVNAQKDVLDTSETRETRDTSETHDTSSTRSSDSEQASARSTTETSESAKSAAALAPPLTTLTLGSGTQIITTDRPAITDDSLAIYARNMGLEESVIQKLLNPPVSTPMQNANSWSESTPTPSVSGLTLGSGTEIITTDRPAITDDRLAIYARNMGLDESPHPSSASGLTLPSAPLGSASPFSASPSFSPFAFETQTSLVQQGVTGLKSAPLLATPMIHTLSEASGGQAIMANLTAVQPQLAATSQPVSPPMQSANSWLESTPTPSVSGLTLPSAPLGSASPFSASPSFSPFAFETPTSLVQQGVMGLKSAPLLATPMIHTLSEASGGQAIMANLTAVQPQLAATSQNLFSAAWPASTPLPQVSSVANMGAFEPKLLATTDSNTAVVATPEPINGLPANTNMISTAAILSMLSNDLSAKQIDGLSELYDEPVAVDAEDASTGSMPVLDTARAGTSNKLPSATPSVAQLPTNMAEIYDKLSAKLNTELAARMHQQISEGQWKMKFALKPASLGAVDIQLEMRDGKLAALLQAENPLTQDLLRHGSDKLKQTLSDLGLAQASVQIGQGQSQGHAQGHRSSPSETAQFRDNPTQVDNQNSEDTAKPLPRRNSLSQFDLYA